MAGDIVQNIIRTLFDKDEDYTPNNVISENCLRVFQNKAEKDTTLQVICMFTVNPTEELSYK